MTDAGQPIEQQIRFVADESSARRVIDAANDIEDAAERVNTALRAAEGAWLPDIVGDAARAERAVRDVEDALEDIDGKRVRVDIDVNEDRIRSRLDTVDRIGTVGSQVAGGLGNSGLGNAAGLVGDLASSLATFNPVVIASTAALATGAIAAARYAEAVERGNEVVESFADGLVTALETGSREGIQALIQAEQARIRVAEATREILIAEAQGAQSDIAAILENTTTPALNTAQNVALSLAQAISGGVILPTEDAIQTASQYTAQISEQNSIINRANAALDAYNLILDDFEETVVGNGLAVKQAAQEFRDGIRPIEAVSEAWANAARNAVALAEAERLAAERRAQTEKETNQRLIAYQQAQQAAQSEAASAYNDQLLDAINNVTEAGADAAKAQNDLANAEQKSAARIADIIAQGQEKQDDLFTDYKERRLDSEEDLNDRLEEIEQRRLKSTHDAIADRDVLAFDMAQDAAQEESEREQKQADKDAARDERNYQRQVQQSERANRRLLDNEYSRQNEELTLKRAAAAAARADLQNAQFAERAIRAQGYMQNINDAAIAGYQIGKTLINAVQSAINAGNFTVVGNDMRFGIGSNQGMTPVQVDRQIENAFRQVFAR